MPAKLIRCVYEIKLMDVFGQGIQSFHCPVCGKAEVSNVFDAASGGLLCDGCKGRAKHPLHLSDDAVYTIQYIMVHRLARCTTSMCQILYWRRYS